MLYAGQNKENTVGTFSAGLHTYVTSLILLNIQISSAIRTRIKSIQIRQMHLQTLAQYRHNVG